jgi:acyl-CoA synthetase (AMP-forming)/AMP-acid ligase II
MENRFVGYYNQPKLSQAKLIQNAFVQGDQYMRTGDLLYKTKDHFWYFADRAGDTFRWKGENVSTAEVADTLGHLEGIASCTVYGVSVPGQDGRAGMVAVVLKDSYWEEDKDAPIPVVAATTVERDSEAGDGDAPSTPASAAIAPQKLNEKALDEFMDRLAKHASKRLPSYAIPRFVRICESELEITGTFKNKKVELKKEGFDLEKIHERLYWWTPKGRYMPFEQTQLGDLRAGRARL